MDKHQEMLFLILQVWQGKTPSSVISMIVQFLQGVHQSGIARKESGKYTGILPIGKQVGIIGKNWDISRRTHFILIAKASFICCDH